MPKPATNFFKRVLHILPFIVIGAGIALRLAVFFQNRCLIVDEANIARNLYERDMAGLLLPLSYEQYAPPVFLWVQELITHLLGFSEYALKLLPLLCGFASLWLLYKVLKHFTDNSSIWYVLLLIATGYLYIRYTTEVKQYMPDMVITLLLMLFALHRDISRMSVMRFTLFWLMAGTFAIWSSMPSVFVLAGIGAYYLYQVFRGKMYGKLWPLLIVGIAWAAQFAAYYFLMLKPQIHSQYLQSWHSKYFLNVFPFAASNWADNWNVFAGVLGNMGGHWIMSIVFHLVTLCTGAIWLLRKDSDKGILVVVPIVLVLIAAFMHQYTLIPRLVLFAAPLFMVLIAKGLQLLFSTGLKPFTAIVAIVCIICAWNFNSLNLFVNRIEVEEMTASLDYIQQQEVPCQAIYTDDISTPGYIYYTSIHPKHVRYKSLPPAKVIHWDTDYAHLGKSFTGRSAILNSFIDDHEVYGRHHEQLRESNDEVGRFDATNSHIIIYIPKK